jgi:MurNAc alpha-1-phosphate uridylyltransferase
MSTLVVPQTAMVLAAGLGNRMRPITDHTPKPLVEVAGKTMLDRALDHLAAVGVGRAVVNIHHLADRITDHLKARLGGPRIVFSDERAALLETGGGLTLARPLLGDQPIYALNADMIWLDGAQPALARLAEAWDPARMDALLLLVPTAQAHGYDGRGDFITADGDSGLDAKARAILSRPQAGAAAPFMYGGVQILKPQLFDACKAEPWSLNLLFSDLLARGRLYGVPHNGQWFHVGTPDAIAPTGRLIALAESSTLAGDAR